MEEYQGEIRKFHLQHQMHSRGEGGGGEFEYQNNFYWNAYACGVSIDHV